MIRAPPTICICTATALICRDISSMVTFSQINSLAAVFLMCLMTLITQPYYPSMRLWRKFPSQHIA